MTTSSRSTRSRNPAVLSSRASSSSVASKNRNATGGRAAGGDEEDRDEEKSEATTSKGAGAQQGRRVIRLRTRSSQRGGGGAATGVEENWDQAEMPSPPKDEEKDVTKEEQGKMEEEELKLYERWAEEYYEIVEQLPLELHRTFALMKELETKMQSKIKFMASHTIAYRDARLSHRSKVKEGGSGQEQTANVAAAGRELVESGAGGEEEEVAAVVVGESSDMVMPNYGTSSDADAEGEEYDEDVYHEAPVVMSTTTTAMRPSKGSQDALSVTKASSPTRQVASKNSAASTPRAARQSLLSGIARASSEAIRAAEEKVGLAVTAYDWVDRHIRRLDGDLQRSESSLLLGLRAGTEASRGVRDALGKREHTGSGEGVGGSMTYNNRSNAANGWGGDDDSMMSGQSTPMISGLAASSGGKRDNNNSSKNWKRKNKEYVDASDANASTTLLADMAIDPNEPKYCYCDQVSSGDMVACDNEDCPREWFHYHCIGLASPPKGRWYCLFCAPPGFKGSGTFPDNAPCLPPGYGGNKRSSYLGSGGGGNGQSKKKKRKK